MKFLIYVLLLLLFIPLFARAQELVLATNQSEPVSLYRQVNESLNDGDTRLAKHTFEKVIEFYECEGRVEELPQSYLGMALAFALNGHYPESIRYHKKALRAHHKYRKNESDDSIRMNLGLTYKLAGKDRKARKMLDPI